MREIGRFPQNTSNHLSIPWFSRYLHEFLNFEFGKFDQLRNAGQIQMIRSGDDFTLKTQWFSASYHFLSSLSEEPFSPLGSSSFYWEALMFQKWYRLRPRYSSSVFIWFKTRRAPSRTLFLLTISRQVFVKDNSSDNRIKGLYTVLLNTLIHLNIKMLFNCF